MGPSYYLDFATDTPTASPVRSNTGVTPTTSGDPAWFSSPLSIPLEEIAYSDAPSLIAAQAEEQSSAAHSGAAQAATRSSGSVLSPMGLRVRADEASVSEQRAWQGTIYIPENYDKDKPTKLTFPANVYENADGTGTPYPQTYSLTLNGKDSAGGYVNDNEEPGVLRSNMYDIVATATKLGGFDITFSVQAWTPEQLTYDLHGPYYLHIDKTQVPVKSGEVSKIWYNTDAPSVSIESPLYNNLPIFVRENREVSDTLYIKLNPAITPGTTIPESDRYFHIVVNKLKKRIDVSPLTLTPYVEITPTEINWNVREFISSGSYSDDKAVPITVETNLKRVSLTYSWDSSTQNCVTAPGANGSNVILTDGVSTSYIGYKNINNPSNNSYVSFWNTSHTLKLTYQAYDWSDNAYGEPIDVTINVEPLALDYTIYARFPSSWTNPHIYVYQCLEFPADTKDPDRANKPIATGSDGHTAALEYSFTGKIAFLGWGVGEYNNPNASNVAKVEPFNGFYYFKDDTTWDPSKVNENHYNVMDFCSSFRASTICNANKCNSDNDYNKLWPGIAMKAVEDRPDLPGTWWVFTLTGVATPGKSLIMFSDTHDGNDNRRYPGYTNGSKNPDPGYPLFDYPSRIGYIDFIGNGTFSPQPPEPSSEYNFRIYWPKDWSYIHMWLSSPNYNITPNWGDGAGTESDVSGYQKYDFTFSKATYDSEKLKTFCYKFEKDGSDTETYKTLASVFGDDLNSINCAYIDESRNLIKGVPSPVKTMWEKNNVIRVRFYNYTYAYVYDNGGNENSYNGSFSSCISKEDNISKYITFTMPHDEDTKLQIILHYNDGKDDNRIERSILYKDIKSKVDVFDGVYEIDLR